MRKADIEAALAAGETEFVVKRNVFRYLSYYHRPDRETRKVDYIGRIERRGEGWRFHYTENSSGTRNFRDIESRDIVCTLAQFAAREAAEDAAKAEQDRQQAARNAQSVAFAEAPESLALIAEYEQLRDERIRRSDDVAQSLADECAALISEGVGNMLDTYHGRLQEYVIDIQTCKFILQALKKGGIPNLARKVLDGQVDVRKGVSRSAVNAVTAWIDQLAYSGAPADKESGMSS